MDKKVIVYSTPTCHFCHMVKDYFNENNISFVDHDVATDLEARQAMLERSGQMGVPQILIDDELVLYPSHPYT